MVSEILDMQHGKRSAAWDHTAALIIHMRRVVGDKKTQWEQLHPFAKSPKSQADKRAQFKEFNNQFRKKNT